MKSNSRVRLSNDCTIRKQITDNTTHIFSITDKNYKEIKHNQLQYVHHVHTSRPITDAHNVMRCSNLG